MSAGEAKRELNLSPRFWPTAMASRRRSLPAEQLHQQGGDNTVPGVPWRLILPLLAVLAFTFPYQANLGDPTKPKKLPFKSKGNFIFAGWE
jgi:hypothetical protein